MTTDSKPDLRREMPNVARTVDLYRQRYGADWVNEQVARGIRGEPDRFFAFEGGRFLGTPFSGGELDDRIARLCALSGQHFVGMRFPEIAHG